MFTTCRVHARFKFLVRSTQLGPTIQKQEFEPNLELGMDCK